MKTENERLAATISIRGQFPINEALYEMEKQIVKTIDTIRAGSKVFSAAQIAEALSDRELATLELWAGEDDKVIRDECERRRAEYEAFARRFAPRGKTEPATETTS